MCHSTSGITGTYSTTIMGRGELNYSKSFKGALQVYSNCNRREREGRTVHRLRYGTRSEAPSFEPPFGAVRLLVDDDDFAEMGAAFEMAVGFSRLVERETPIYHGPQP